ncbi:UDP-N-acetylglucosamine:LPS N-acetylglucosamine transferase [Mycolicibacterium aurum]|uniref:UDP-N-acetylglucosamine:LPS N-acetylglucosamine transferase n=1 Tax=Mycolicibacterium aurum TaxID=1791 RepID=A0A448IT10_MYCAU|nr:UDP-N-acetylglucosamine:LPS N-acetylglucosamine transferase [Mycolicibacterium aurum]
MLPRDDAAGSARHPAANGVLHWAPHHDAGLRERMARLAQWVAENSPAAAVVDVSVEVATLLRLLGVPVIVVAMPGHRVDSPHQMVYQLADHIVAPWPAALNQPSWLSPYAHKTSYVGGISRFDGRTHEPGPRAETPTVLVLNGAGGSALRLDMIAACQQQHPEYLWRTLGVAGGPWVDDPWPTICAADVIIAHAGQNSIADIAAAQKPAIIIAQARPFDEQTVTAQNLARAGLAIVLDDWPDPGAWPELIAAARRLDVGQWSRWQTAGAAARAAQAIADVARHCAADGSG